MAKSPAAPQGGTPQAVSETANRPGPDAAIRTGILNSLGSPAGLYRVAVLELWKGHYRVNVMTGQDATQVRIVNSYFVEADERGNILRATPPLKKEYA